MNPSLNSISPALVYILIGLVIVWAICAVGGVLITGTIIAACLVGSAIFTLNRLPCWIRRQVVRFPLITNLAATAIIASVVGTSTATGLVACVLTFLFIDLVQEAARASRGATPASAIAR